MANFGYETIGTVDYSVLGSSTIRYMHGSVFTVPESGIADSITVALKGSYAHSRRVTCGIYDHNTNSLVGQTEVLLISLTTSYKWFTFNFAEPKPNLVAGTPYILVATNQLAYFDGARWYYVYFPYDNGDANQGHYGTVPTELVLPDPPPEWYHTTRKHSIYCSYTPVKVKRVVGDGLVWVRKHA